MVSQMTWRTMKLVDPAGRFTSVPNSIVAEASICDFSLGSVDRDSVQVYLPVGNHPDQVVDAIESAIGLTETAMQKEAHGVTVKGTVVMDEHIVMQYSVWFSLSDYFERNSTRNELWKNIWKELDRQNIATTPLLPADATQA